MSDADEVVCFQIVRDRPLPEGGTPKAERISPAYFDRHRLAQSLEQVRDMYPDAYMIRAVLFPSDRPERDEMIADLEAGGYPSIFMSSTGLRTFSQPMSCQH